MESNWYKISTKREVINIYSKQMKGSHDMENVKVEKAGIDPAASSMLTKRSTI